MEASADMTPAVSLEIPALRDSLTARRLVDLLGTDPDVLLAQPETETQRLHLQLRPSAALPEIIRKLRAAGLAPETRHYRLPVTGMSCTSCAAGATRMLQMQAGILSAEVHFATGTAQIETLPGTDLNPARQILQVMGYDLHLEPEASLPDARRAQQAAHLSAQGRRVVWAWVLAAPLILIGMLWMNVPGMHWVMAALATPLVWVFGWPFFRSAGKLLLLRQANMDTLVALSAGIAWVFSLLNLLFPGFWESRGMHAHVWFEAAGGVTAFVLLGKYLEERARYHTGSALHRLLHLQVQEARRLDAEGKVALVPVASLRRGDRIQVLPGARIPADGTVVSGDSWVDESLLSGEAAPVSKGPGAPCYAGTLNQQGVLVLTVTDAQEGTVLAGILQRVQAAQETKAPVQRLADRISAVFVPVVLGLALLSGLVWGIAGGAQGWVLGLHAFVTVLVIACPCALGLATPTALMAGMGRAAESGILIRDASILEQARGVQVLLLDKTGTLTTGEFTVRDSWWGREDAAGWMMGAAAHSGHPLAVSAYRYLAGQGTEPLPGTSYENLPGKGIRCETPAGPLRMGSLAWLETEGVQIPAEAAAQCTAWETAGLSLILLALGDRVGGMLALSDTLKPGVAAAVQTLQARGLELHILSGDRQGVVQRLADDLGIPVARGGMLPQDKAEWMRRLQAQGRRVAMVGDGINDAEALAGADLGVAMGTGADAAQEAAHMTLAGGDIRQLVRALRIATATLNTIRGNLVWAFVYNVLAIPVAAGLLYPFTHFLLNPMWAGAAMAFSSVSVVLNSLLLYRRVR